MNTAITYAAALKEIRKEARDNGLVFKRSTGTINNKPAYQLNDRNTGYVVRVHMTFWLAYEQCVCDGFGDYKR